MPRLLRRAIDRVVSRIRNKRVPTWYDPHFRLPFTSLESQLGLEPRRADLVAWYLEDARILAASDLRHPPRAGYHELALVHTQAYLESLTHPATLARVFGVEPWEVREDEVMRTVRLACGGTIEAARTALDSGSDTFNLLGGFHHAAPDHGGGLCAINDIAVAIAVLRRDGFEGRVAIIDLDAHPPDGTAACLEGDDRAWIGSLSGSDWGPLPGVDENLVPAAEDAHYLQVLDGLLHRRPPAELAFVIAGGDVLAQDRLGNVSLTLRGARERDRRVEKSLRGVPTVWLPGGGYHPEAWKVLAGTALVLAGRSRSPIPHRADPMATHYARISDRLGPGELDPGEWITEEDMADLFGPSRRRHTHLLGYYSSEGLEYVLHVYGILEHLARLGYRDFHVEINVGGAGERFQLLGHRDGSQHLLIEAVLDRKEVAGHPLLFVNWLTLRHAAATFGSRRPSLPGQEVPGLGLAREAGELLARMAVRLQLEGVAWRPAWFHTAFMSREDFCFADPARQGRFEALVRDLAHLPLREATEKVHSGQVLLDGTVYQWEADDMVHWLKDSPMDEDTVAAERERARFTVVDPTPEN